ncbi:hypothetical protein O0544_20280 [Edwardsiella anguillarum]|nr:hypothetical protein [Edwardsiella anguillarum]
MNNVDPSWLRRNIGVVLQENVLFNRTIHENIAFANPGMSRADVIRVAKLAGADEFISTLPRAMIRSLRSGAEIFRGQRQRVAIARARPPIHPCLFLMRQPVPLIMKVKISSEKT